jgi:hypothetical protein
MTEEDEIEIVRLFVDYAADFSSLGTQHLLHYFYRPCMAIAPQGVFTLTSELEIDQLFGPMFENLKAQGYFQSEWLDMQIKFLDENMALASNTAVYYNAAGEELERAGGTYVLHKTEGLWKIAVILVHSPDLVLNLG